VIVGTERGRSSPAQFVFSAELDLVDPSEFGLDGTAKEVVWRTLKKGTKFSGHVVRALAEKTQDVAIEHRQ